ncbi:MAG: DMT family transporter [Thermomicrobiales bacterium]
MSPPTATTASVPASLSIAPVPVRWRRWLPLAAVLAAACCWGTQGVAYALILDGIQTDGLTVVTLRAVTATALLWGWLAVADPAALRIPRLDLPAFAALGLIAVTIYYPALFYTFQWTSVGVGTVLLYLAPALVTVGAALFLGEPVTRPKLVALALTFLGCALVVQIFQPANLVVSAPGIGLGLVSAVSYATYSLLGKRLLGRHGMGTVLASYLLLGTLGLIALKLLVSPSTWPAPGEALTIGLYTGIVTTLAPITLFTFGLNHLPSSEATILLTAEPVVAFVLAAAVLGETLNPVQWLGAMAVLGGVVLLTGFGRGSVRANPARQPRSRQKDISSFGARRHTHPFPVESGRAKRRSKLNERIGVRMPACAHDAVPKTADLDR